MNQDTFTQPLALRRPNHIPYLDSLRGLAAVYVVLVHTYVGFDLDTLSPGVRALAEFLCAGKLGVATFMVLSGYSLMIPSARSGEFKMRYGFWTFMKRRTRRIYPTYLAAMLLSLFLLAIVPSEIKSRSFWLTTFEPAFDPWNILAHLGLFHNLDNAWLYKINAPFWSLATEWQIGFLLPLVLLPVARRFGIFAILPLSLCLSLLPMFVFRSYETAAPWFLFLFAMGATASWLGETEKEYRFLARHAWLLRWSVGLSMVAVSVLISMRSHPLIPHGWKHTFFVHCAWGMFVSTILLALAIGRTWLVRMARIALEKPLCVWLGKFSYSLYLTHAIAVCALECLFPGPGVGWSGDLHLFMRVTTGLVGSLTFAILFYHLVERPLVSKLVKKRSTNQPLRKATLPNAMLRS